MIAAIRAVPSSARRVLRFLAERAAPELAREIAQRGGGLRKIDLILLREQVTRGC